MYGFVQIRQYRACIFKGFVIPVVIKYAGNWQRPRLINIPQYIYLTTVSTPKKCFVPVGKAIDALLVIFFVTRENEKKMKKSV
jgi:hypothetical protein